MGGVLVRGKFTHRCNEMQFKCYNNVIIMYKIIWFVYQKTSKNKHNSCFLHLVENIPLQLSLETNVQTHTNSHD